MRCMIRYHLYNLKNVKNTHGGVLLLVKLQAEAESNFIKSNTPPWVFFTFFKLYKWYRIAQRITNFLHLRAVSLTQCLITHKQLDRSWHCVKSVRIRSFPGPYFPVFGMITERYGVSLRIQLECWKIRTRKNPKADTFHAVWLLHTQRKLKTYFETLHVMEILNFIRLF